MITCLNFIHGYYNEIGELEGAIITYCHLKQRSHLNGEDVDTVNDIKQGYMYQRAGQCY